MLTTVSVNVVGMANCVLHLPWNRVGPKKCLSSEGLYFLVLLESWSRVYLLLTNAMGEAMMSVTSEER